MSKTILPNTFILGSAKCATTSLCHWLNQNKNICIVKNKEPLFFSTNEYSKGIKWYSKEYLQHYNDEKIIIDATTMHLIIPYVADRIKLSVNSAKFIIICRDPIARALSHWWMQFNYRPGYTSDCFYEAMEYNLSNFSYQKFKYEYERMKSFDGAYESYIPSYIEQGLYHYHGSRYEKKFGEKNVLYVIYDDLVNETTKTLSLICDFLNIDYSKPFDLKAKKVSKNKIFDIYKNLETVKRNKVIKKIIDAIFIRDLNFLSEKLDINLLKLWCYRNEDC